MRLLSSEMSGIVSFLYSFLFFFVPCFRIIIGDGRRKKGGHSFFFLSFICVEASCGTNNQEKEKGNAGMERKRILRWGRDEGSGDGKEGLNGEGCGWIGFER